MGKLTREEMSELIQAAQAAEARGDVEEASRLRKKRPLPPHLAQAAKEIMGIEHLRTKGYDLSEAEATYGKEWLNG